MPPIMTTASDLPPQILAPPTRNLFGIPLDRLGWFACLLLSFAAGLLAFCVTCFVAIFSILFYNSVGHHAVDFAASYKFFGLPAGLLVLVLALGYMGSLVMRRAASSRARSL